MVINLALEEQARALRIADQATSVGEAWLFDPTHNAESMGVVSLEGAVKFPAQSITLIIIE